GKPYNFCCICRLCCINFVWLVGAIAFLAVLPVFAINLAAVHLLLSASQRRGVRKGRSPVPTKKAIAYFSRKSDRSFLPQIYHP
ncbi:hypothetical protein, partial [Microcoleus anatoxicus]|uniref:hypothetical protein n=1 Tax=Microcoleus anatoxicus TaxID=2705319 RepID=UPI0030CA10D3